MRERGLKHNSAYKVYPEFESLPMRERGLKPYLQHEPQVAGLVAPYAGAWIETLLVKHILFN